MNYEGAFSLIASVIISVVGAALLRIGKMQEKWRVKLAEALEAPVGKKIGKIAWVRRILEKYAIFILPFITVLREGIEAIVFVAGVTFGVSAKSVPLPVVVGLIFGIFVGYLLYKYVVDQRLLTTFPATNLLLQGWCHRQAPVVPGLLDLPFVPCRCRPVLSLGVVL